jgi:hypothetical protein
MPTFKVENEVSLLLVKRFKEMLRRNNVWELPMPLYSFSRKK